NVMLATGGAIEQPSKRNSHIRWIFSTALTNAEIKELARTRLQREPGEVRLISVGRQEAGKGSTILLKALPLIHRQFPHATLDIVGGGSYLSRLKLEAEELGIIGHVSFHGKVDHAQVLNLMRKAHLFCFPTASEGFPKAVLE